MVNNKTIGRVLKKPGTHHVNNLYLNYITALVKSESLQNRLENTCSMLINTPSSLITNNVGELNNNLNNLLVKVMLMQNTIDYITVAKK